MGEYTLLLFLSCICLMGAYTLLLFLSCMFDGRILFAAVSIVYV